MEFDVSLHSSLDVLYFEWARQKGRRALANKPGVASSIWILPNYRQSHTLFRKKKGKKKETREMLTATCSDGRIERVGGSMKTRIESDVFSPLLGVDPPHIVREGGGFSSDIALLFLEGNLLVGGTVLQAHPSPPTCHC